MRGFARVDNARPSARGARRAALAIEARALVTRCLAVAENERGLAVECGRETAPVAPLPRRHPLRRVPAEARRRRADRAGRPRLPAREREILLLVAEGLTDRDIGTRLFISHRTVGHHVSSLLAKLGATRRSELAAVAHRSGLAGVGASAVEG